MNTQYTRNLCPKCETMRFTDPGEPCWHCKPAAAQRAILAARVSCITCADAFERRHMSDVGTGPICPACVEDGRWKEVA